MSGEATGEASPEATPKQATSVKRKLSDSLKPLEPPKPPSPEELEDRILSAKANSFVSTQPEPAFKGKEVSIPLWVLLSLVVGALAVGAYYCYPCSKTSTAVIPAPSQAVIPTTSAEPPASSSAKPTAGTNRDFTKKLKTSMKDRLFTKAELKAYDGSVAGKPIYLGILGEVFDVTKGAKHYSRAQNGGYSFFSGIDGSAAFVTGEFNEKGLTDQVENLTPSQIAGIRDWADGTYHKEYKYVGKLIGNFYDEKGEPTAALEKVYEMLEVHQKEEEIKQSDEKLYPRCNSRWSQQTGGMVWCDGKSGGVDRSWIGYPRIFTPRPGEPSRCACVEFANVPDSRFEVYAGCQPLETSCVTSRTG